MISFLKLTSTSKYQMSIFLFLSTLLLAVDVSHQLSTPTPTAATKPSTNKVVWFRNHVLRIQDNQALDEAISECQRSSSSSSSTSLTDSASAIIPIYLWDEQCNDDINTSGGTASDLFIAHTLKSLNDSMDGMLGQGFIEKSVTADADETTTQNQQNYHSNIDINEIIDTNASTMVKELVSICEKSSSSDIYYIRSNNVPLEEKIIHYLHENGITPHPSHGCSLLDYSTLDVPWTDIILAHPWRSPLIPFVDYVLEKLEENPPSKPIDVPMETLLPFISHAESKIFNNPIEIEALLQTMGRSSGGTEWGTTIIESFSQNNDGAMKELDSFIQSMTLKGAEKRTHFTSRLSPYLARGLLSPKQVYHAILSKGDEYDSASIVRRICWRDYTHAVVSLFPDVLYGRPIRLGYGDYVDDDLDDEKLHLLKMWKKGLTGIPIVDAGMRQLEIEGYMPQKVRLACSTCLVEGLNIPWQYGMQHFKEYLVDFDEAINCNMWQNAGCVGFDPYYVGLKYRKRAYWDRDGSYVKHWCPELKNLPDYYVFQLDRGMTKKVDCLYEPWMAPPETLESAGVQIGQNYPARVCDDRSNRQDFFDKLRYARTQWESGMMDDGKRDIVPLGRDSAAERIGIFTPRPLQLRRR